MENEVKLMIQYVKSQQWEQLKKLLTKCLNPNYHSKFLDNFFSTVPNPYLSTFKSLVKNIGNKKACEVELSWLLADGRRFYWLR